MGTTQKRRGLFERLMFSVMGPPQIGVDAAPEGFVPDPAAELCPTCRRSWDEHERVHSGSATYLRCPQAQPGD